MGMSGRKKMTTGQVNNLQEMSLDQIKSRFYEIADVHDSQQQPASSDGKTSKLAGVPASSFASLDLGAGGTESKQPLTDEDYINKYLEPGMLEARPEYANGSTPETAIHQSPDGSFFQRTKLAFTNKSPEDQIKVLEEKYGKGNALLSKGGSLTVKDKDGLWKQLDPKDGSGAGEGSFWTQAFEKTQDILADNADLISIPAGIAAGVAGAPMIAAAGAGAVGTAALIGAYSGLASAGTKILGGRVFGTYDTTPENVIKDVGLEMVLSAGGQAFVPGVKYGAAQLGNMFTKAAPTFKTFNDAAKNAYAKVIGFTSGVGEDAAQYWVNKPEKVGQMVKRFGGDEVAAINASITDTKDVVGKILKARNGFYKAGMDNVVTLAKDDFAPVISNQIKDNFVRLEQKGWGKVVNNKFILNSPEELAKLNTAVVSELEGDGAYQVAQKYVNHLNKWASKESATGEAGARQFYAFKKSLGDNYDELEALAEASGAKSTLGLVANNNAALKESVFKNAINPTKNKEAMDAFVKLETDYSAIKTAIAPFERAAKIAKRKGDTAADYRQLYQDTFAQIGISPKTAAAKGSLNATLNVLGKFDEGIGTLVDDIGARKAASAAQPWARKGLIGQAAVLGGAASMNPGMIAGAALTSPKLNYEAAKIASSMYKGLEWMRVQPSHIKEGLFKDPSAMQKFMGTMLQTPGVEAQVGSQLGQQLMGQQNGQ